MEESGRIQRRCLRISESILMVVEGDVSSAVACEPYNLKSSS